MLCVCQECVKLPYDAMFVYVIIVSLVLHAGFVNRLL
jgi:hypothetical protein